MSGAGFLCMLSKVAKRETHSSWGVSKYFQWRIYGEAVRRGLFEARHVICLTDGAEWIRNKRCFGVCCC